MQLRDRDTGQCELLRPDEEGGVCACACACNDGLCGVFHSVSSLSVAI